MVLQGGSQGPGSLSPGPTPSSAQSPAPSWLPPGHPKAIPRRPSVLWKLLLCFYLRPKTPAQGVSPERARAPSWLWSGPPLFREPPWCGALAGGQGFPGGPKPHGALTRRHLTPRKSAADPGELATSFSGGDVVGGVSALSAPPGPHWHRAKPHGGRQRQGLTAGKPGRWEVEDQGTP